ncbi:MAG: D-alanine--D-alanine ligase [Actinomycetota bacterium]|jgi:D-alanine-D-alanine ligase|nr:D-alanine--D-alanine ligase [Actinomycetota bacterium]
MRPVKVAVLAGGLSLEREVSLRSGGRVAEALADRGHSVTRLDLDDQLVPALVKGDFDAVYLALHGKAGEDGTIQGLLDLLGMSYTGPDAMASALAWDKVVAKGVYRRGGVDTPEWVALSIDAIRDMGAVQALDRVIQRLGTPVVVKPSHGGAALGVRLVANASDLPAALVAAYSYDDVVLVERYVEGVEVAVSIVGGEVLPPVEVAPRIGPYDFSARYTHGATQFHAPARLPNDALAACAGAGRAAWRLAGCRHVTRADMIVDASGRPWLLELDTCPGMTETSLLPMAAAAHGWSFADLCERVLAAALASAGPEVDAAVTP